MFKRESLKKGEFRNFCILGTFILYNFLNLLLHLPDNFTNLTIIEPRTYIIPLSLKKSKKDAPHLEECSFHERQISDCEVKYYMAFPFQLKFKCTRVSTRVENQNIIFVKVMQNSGFNFFSF